MILLTKLPSVKFGSSFFSSSGLLASEERQLNKDQKDTVSFSNKNHFDMPAMRWLVATTWWFVLTGQCRQVQGKLGGDFLIKRDKEDKARATTNGEEIVPRLRNENGKTNRQLQSLTFLGETPDPERFPLGLCEGDCDDDQDVSIHSSDPNSPFQLPSHRLTMDLFQPQKWL